MNKIQKKIKIIENINNNFKLQLLLCVVLSFIVIIIFSVFNKVIDKDKFHEYTIKDNIDFINSVDKIVTEKDELKLHGYAFLLERNSLSNKISLFLLNVDTEEEIWFDVDQEDRSDVVSYFDSEYDYNNSGFIATIDEKKLNENQSYEIIINIDYYIEEKNSLKMKKVRQTVSTNKYILNSRLYTYNPNEFDDFNIHINSEMLNEVLSNGQQCFYLDNIGMYVYYYKDKLYWIASNNFDFEDNGSTFIYYRLYTSQFNKLPVNRIKYKYDNLDFIFEEYEYFDEMTAPYRVAIRDIPDDYAITYIRTGVHDREGVKKMVWDKYFQLNNYINN